MEGKIDDIQCVPDDFVRKKQRVHFPAPVRDAFFLEKGNKGKGTVVIPVQDRGFDRIRLQFLADSWILFCSVPETELPDLEEGTETSFPLPVAKKGKPSSSALYSGEGNNHLPSNSTSLSHPDSYKAKKNGSFIRCQI